MEGIVATLERGTHLIGRYLDSAVAELGITHGEAHVLAQVARTGPKAIAALHHEFGHKRSTLTNILDRLERRGLVRRQLNPSDRRSFVVHLTAPGRIAARRVTRAIDELEREVATRSRECDLAGVEAVVRSLERALDGCARQAAEDDA